MGKDSDLLEAARCGNVDKIQKILSQKTKRGGPLASLRRAPGVNLQDSSGYSALHHASLNGHTDCVRVLLSHEGLPNLRDERGSSPLHLAAWAGHQDIVKLLLTQSARPANPNLQTIDLETPLHCAAQHGHTGALTTLLAHGADPSISNVRGEMPLHLAAQYGRVQVVQMLIRAHPELLLPYKEQNDDSSFKSQNRTYISTHSPLHLASRNGHTDVVAILLAAGVDVNLLTSSGTALHEAALCGKDSVVRELLESGADLKMTDSEGRTALDLLNQFPPHVTKGITSVIIGHRRSRISDDKSADSMEESEYFQDQHNSANHSDKEFAYITTGTKIPKNGPNSNWTNYVCTEGITTSSFSSSLTSFGSADKTMHGNSADNFLITRGEMELSDMSSENTRRKKSPTPPKKPPRRNTSISSTVSVFPSIGDTYSNYMLSSYSENSNMNNVDILDQYVDLTNSFQELEPSLDDDDSINNFSNQPLILYRSYNPKRKLRRIRNNFNSVKKDNTENITNENKAADIAPLSPSHYNQPPTPDHPPPNPIQAESVIYERIRPLSQEYKRKSQGGGEVLYSFHLNIDQACGTSATSTVSLSSTHSPSSGLYCESD